MKKGAFLFTIPLLLLLACDPEVARMGRVRDQVLPSGKTVKVFMINLGISDASKDEDSLSLEYITSNPNSDASKQQEEAKEVFELIKSTCVQWGINHADLSAYPSNSKRGQYTNFQFRLEKDGKWSCKSMVGHSY